MSALSVTALMTTYNCADVVGETIQSILAQTLADFELLIVDDGSTDGTVEKIRSLCDPRIRLYPQADNAGVGYRLNQALQWVNSAFIAKVDADDICMPQRFEKQRDYLLAHPELGMVKSYFEYFTDDPVVAGSERYRQFRQVKEPQHNSIDTPQALALQLMRWNCVVHTSYFARTDVVKDIGYPDTRIGEDYSLFYRAVKSGVGIGCVPECLVKMRLSQSSVTTKADSALHFAKTLVELKQDELRALHSRHGELWIYGTGALAKGMMQSLPEIGLSASGFIDRNAADFYAPELGRYPVLALSETLPKGVVIAAQPVRDEICSFFINAGWVEWSDFMVIA